MFDMVCLVWIKFGRKNHEVMIILKEKGIYLNKKSINDWIEEWMKSRRTHYRKNKIKTETWMN